MKEKHGVLDNTLYTRFILLLSYGPITIHDVMVYRGQIPDKNFRKNVSYPSVRGSLLQLGPYIKKEKKLGENYYSLDLEKLISDLKRRLWRKAILHWDQLNFKGIVFTKNKRLYSIKIDSRKVKSSLYHNLKPGRAEIQRFAKFLEGQSTAWKLGNLTPDTMENHFHNFTKYLAEEPHSDRLFTFAAVYSLVMDLNDDEVIYKSLTPKNLKIFK